MYMHMDTLPTWADFSNVLNIGQRTQQNIVQARLSDVSAAAQSANPYPFLIVSLASVNRHSNDLVWFDHLF